MTSFGIFILIFSAVYSVHPGSRRVSAQTHTEPPVYQPDDQISVDIGHSATLQCCASEAVSIIIDWFKQPNGENPQNIVTVYKNAGERFYNKIEKTRYRIERSSNCFNLIILNITQSDEAVYYCALTNPSFVFADGTYLKIKETSKPVLCENSVVCEATLHENNTNINTHNRTEREMIRSLHGTTLGLGTALALCVLLIIALIYFILRRRKCDKINTALDNCPGTRQESEADEVNYAALHFSKKKTKRERRRTELTDECVYSGVNTTVKYKINDS